MSLSSNTRIASSSVTPETVSPAMYWEARARRYAQRSLGLRAVCSYGMPWLYNFVIDLCQRRALRPWLQRRDHGTALDVGCGVGRWTLRLAMSGMRVVGVDVSPFMIERAKARAREAAITGTFLTGDLGALELGRQFDLILCVTVLQHITHPEQAASAIANLARHLAPGGRLVLLEAAPSESSQRCNSDIFTARTLEWYRDALARCGLSIERLRGVDPMPLKTLLLPYYKRVPDIVRPLLANLTAAISLPFDWVLGPYLTRYSWHKVIVARRAPDLGAQSADSRSDRLVA
jgi:SAM-dependent methyltransferase